MSAAEKDMTAHEEKAKELRSKATKIKLAIKEAEDKEQAEKDEAEGHFRQASKMDAEAKALGDAAKAAGKKSKEVTAKKHAEIEKHIQAAAVAASEKGVAAMHSTLFASLKKRVQQVAHNEAVKAADSAAKKEVKAASAKFLAGLRPQMVASARKDGKAAAMAAAKSQIAEHHDKFGRVTKAVAEQAKKDVNKMAEKRAEKEVKKRAGAAAHDEVSKRAEGAAKSEVLKASASQKKAMGDLAKHMSKKQAQALKMQNVAGAKTSVHLAVPESAHEEQEKLILVLKKDGPHKALRDAEQDVEDAKDEVDEAGQYMTLAKLQLKDAESDLKAMKSAEERRLATKVVVDAKKNNNDAKALVKTTKLNLQKQEKVKAHTDKAVKNYEAEKKTTLSSAANEVTSGKHALIKAKHAAKLAHANAQCPVDKEKASEALKKISDEESLAKDEEGRLDKHVAKASTAGVKTKQEKKSEAAIAEAGAASGKVAKATVLKQKADEAVAHVKTSSQKKVAKQIAKKANAALGKAKSAESDAKAKAKHHAKALVNDTVSTADAKLHAKKHAAAQAKKATSMRKKVSKLRKMAPTQANKALEGKAKAAEILAHKAASKASEDHNNAMKADAAAAHTAQAKSDHDLAKLKQETELQFNLKKLKASLDAVGKDEAVLKKLKTAKGAQIAFDLGKLKKAVKKKPHNSHGKKLMEKAKKDQRKAKQMEDKVNKDVKKAKKKLSSSKDSKAFVKVVKKIQQDNKRGVKAADDMKHKLKKNIKAQQKKEKQKAKADKQKAQKKATQLHTINAKEVEAQKLKKVADAVNKQI